VAEALDEGLHLAGSGGVGQRVLQLRQPGGNRGDGARALHGLGDRAPPLHLPHALAEVADGDAPVDGDLALVGLLLARDEPEERRLAGAVRPHEPHFLSAPQDGGGLQEEELAAVLLADGVESDQGARF